MTREEAIDLLDNLIGMVEDNHNSNYDTALQMAIKALEQEPKTGHWVYGEFCSECGCDVPAYIIDWKWQKDMDAKYCPNCGAKMESEVTDADRD